MYLHILSDFEIYSVHFRKRKVREKPSMFLKNQRIRRVRVLGFDSLPTHFLNSLVQDGRRSPPMIWVRTRLPMNLSADSPGRQPQAVAPFLFPLRISAHCQNAAFTSTSDRRPKDGGNG